VNSKQFPFKNVFRTSTYVIFGVFLFSLFVYFLNYHYHIITCLYPQDWNEGSNILPTYVMLQGKNPFDLSNNPQYANIYGILYPLLVFPLAKIWGPTLLVHRIVSGFFVFAGCLVIVFVLRKNKLPLLLSFAGGMTFYPFSIFPNTTTDLAGPHSLGLFLFLMTFFVPYLFNYSKTSLGVSILIGVLAFYTKLYCVLGIPLTALYIFLFKSKKTGALYGFIFLIIFIISVYVANSVMYCYFNNIFFVMTSFNLNGSTAAHAISELTRFYQLQRPLFFLIGINFVVQLVLYIKNPPTMPFKDFFSKTDLFTWREPLLKWDFDINIYGFIITTLFIYFSIGRSMGQFWEYPLQLMSPFFILYIFNCLNKHRLTAFLGMPLIIIALFNVASNFSRNFHEFDKNWEAVDGLVAASNNIFTNPLIIPTLIKYHRPVYDSGHSEYFHLGAERKFLNFKFPPHPEIENRNAEYWREVWALTSQKKFDFLMMYSNYHPFMPNLCILFYRPIGTIQLGSFDSKWRYDFYILVPK